MKVIDVMDRDFGPDKVAALVEQNPVRVTLDDGRSYVAVPESSWSSLVADTAESISHLRRELADITPGSACRI